MPQVGRFRSGDDPPKASQEVRGRLLLLAVKTLHLREDKLWAVGDTTAILLDLFDAPRLFADHAREKHTGTNLNAVRMMVEHQETWFIDIIRTFCRELEANYRRLKAHGCTVGVFCAHGKHRSVCWAWLLHMVLLLLGASSNLVHLSKDS